MALNQGARGIRICNKSCDVARLFRIFSQEGRGNCAKSQRQDADFLLVCLPPWAIAPVSCLLQGIHEKQDMKWKCKRCIMHCCHCCKWKAGLGGDFMISPFYMKPWLSPHISWVSILWVKAFMAQKKAEFFGSVGASKLGQSRDLGSSGASASPPSRQ